MNPSGGANPSQTEREGSDPQIAICLTTHEPPAELLRAQIESIRAQTHENWACMIFDDYSSEEAFAAIVDAVGDDSRFTVERNDQRLGVYRNFERALAAVPAEAGLVALADQDDRWHPDKLASLAARMKAGVTLAYSDMRVTTTDGELVSSTFWT